ncbi:MAG: GNA1162 family protein [Elusimicrobiota bacterium]
MPSAKFFTGLILISVIFIASCAPVQISPPASPLVQSIAILPFDNESNDLKADDIMQKIVYEALKGSGYNPVDIAHVNEKLAQVGIIDGGQLPVLDPVKIGKDLGVQGLLYGYVENFDTTNIGFYFQRKVKIQLTLVDALTGKQLWQNEGVGTTTDFNIDPKKAKREFAERVAEQALEKWLSFPLESEAKEAVSDVLNTLPGYVAKEFNNGQKVKEFHFGKSSREKK